ncbi:hypothetical protein BRC90_11145 [Halobacteriales archaeon QS_4_69_34]|nr:MAG: hypothetical protein BRC90_11145 [Halobacteriales archaeon QS_4_69_34]
MGSCPVCGDAISEARPRHVVALEHDDAARPAAPDATRATDRFTKQLCHDCWDALHEEFAGTPSE